MKFMPAKILITLVKGGEHLIAWCWLLFYVFFFPSFGLLWNSCHFFDSTICMRHDVDLAGILFIYVLWAVLQAFVLKAHAILPP